MFRIGQTDPTAKASSTGVDRERAPFRKRQRRRVDLRPVQGQPQLLTLEQRAVRLGQALGETTNVDPLVDLVDADTHVTNFDRRSLWRFEELIGLQPRSISVIVVGKPPRHLVAW